MAQRQTNIAIRAPAADGLNTEDSPYGLSEQFAVRADNAVIDKSGRLSVRESFADYVVTDNVTRTNYIGYTHTVEVTEAAGIDINGTQYIFGIEKSIHTGSPAKDDEYRFVGLSGTTLTAYSYTDPKSNPTGLDNACIVSFNDEALIFSSGNQALVFDGTTVDDLFTGTDDVDYIKPRDDTGVLAAEIDGDVAIAAYGRVWVTGVNDDYNTIYYSDLLNARKWYDGRATPADSQNTAGIIDVSEYWPNGKDRIVGMAAHNGFLIVFGRFSILIYSGVQGDPAAADGLTLQDAIANVGLVSREGICLTGSDLMFVDDTGVKSLGRVIQEKSSPLTTVTGNIARDFASAVTVETDNRNISLEYFLDKDLVVCQFAEQQIAYAIDIRRPASNGNFKVTKWTETEFRRMVYIETGDMQGTFLTRPQELRSTYDTYSSFLKYSGYTSWDSRNVDFVYESPYLTLGDVTTTKYPKRVDFTIRTDLGNTDLTTSWGFGDDLDYSKDSTVFIAGVSEWGVAEWGIGEFGGGTANTERVRVNMKGRGPVIQLAHNSASNGNSMSLVEINLQLLLGRTY